MSNLPIINCDGCGVCCMHMATPPFTPDELDTLPADVRAEFEAIMATRRLQFNVTGDYVPCAWFDWAKRNCRHYEHRPEVCREFEVGSRDCRDMRRDAGILDEAPCKLWLPFPELF